MDVPRNEKKANFLEGVAQQAKFVATSIVSVRTLEKYIFGLLPYVAFIYTMAIRVVEFSSEITKLERFSPRNQHTQRKLLNFESWCNGEVSKIRHHFRN